MEYKVGGVRAECRVQIVIAESQLRTCSYFGLAPEPLPGEHWMQAASRELHQRCTGTRNSTGNTHDPSGQKVDVSTESKATTDQPTTELTISTVESTESYTDGPRYAGCQESYDGGINGGVITIYPPQYPNGLAVFCYNGWMVIQMRYSDVVNFTRSWAEYRDGFGDLTADFWLGNEIVRQLTSEGRWELHVQFHVKDAPQLTDIYLKLFRIAGDNYTLHVQPLSAWPAGKSLANIHSGQPFSTYDRDNDADGNANCAAQLKGGWWFKTCTGGVGNVDLVPTNLNGEYSYPVNYTGQDYRGVR
ncbi:ficolin-3-like [Patiria miniata]|uniref:Fibrinogen C-terminal domain-containing protein n=1 Tax=Patiria miniata TaxID=46514 RepID=A0A914A4U7_PATMI|nr:ficolin-3-like [Patiria miniata]